MILNCIKFKASILKVSLFILLFSESATSASQEYNVRIDGQIVGYNDLKKVKYEISPAYLSYHFKSVQPDSLGRFTINTFIHKTMFFNMIYFQDETRHVCKLVLQPNKNYLFISRGQNKKESKQYSPDIYSLERNINDKNIFYTLDFGQIYYNKIDNGTMGSLYHDDWNLLQPETLIDSLQSRIKRQVSVFSELLRKDQIDQNFFEIAWLNTAYSHAYRLAQTISDTWQIDMFKIEDTTIVNKLYKVYPKIFELYPIKEVKMEQVYGFDKYVDQFMLFIKDYNGEVFKPKRRTGTLIDKALEHADEYLSEKAYKNYKLRNLTSSVAALNIESEKLAKKFLEENPDISNNDAGKLLENVLLPRLEDFNNLSQQEFLQGVIILDKKKPIKSYQELLDSLKGSPFLINCWGTLFPTCGIQFQYNDILHSFLKKNNIAMVYIAFEYNNSPERWKNFIKAYNLVGYHFMSNDEFESDFKKHSGKILKFPTYMIVNSNGNILETNAFYPSEGKKLIKQIKKKLGL